MLQSKRLRFVDLLKYLGSKTSLHDYLHDFTALCDIEGGKYVFPYSKMADMQTMKSEPLPVYDDFDDFLAGGNSLDVPYSKFQNELNKGYTEEECLKRLNMTEVPLPGPELYEQFKAEWDKAGLKTLFDLLEVYVRKDVQPLLRCIEKQQQMFFDLDLLPFYCYSSLSSLSFAYVMKRADQEFKIPDLEFRDLLVKNILGGPSVTNCRGVKIGHSGIDEHRYKSKSKTVRCVSGYDANSLYGINNRSEIRIMYVVICCRYCDGL